jgi:hypothetical protein
MLVKDVDTSVEKLPSLKGYAPIAPTYTIKNRKKVPTYTIKKCS